VFGWAITVMFVPFRSRGAEQVDRMVTDQVKALIPVVSRPTI